MLRISKNCRAKTPGAQTEEAPKTPFSLIRAGGFRQASPTRRKRMQRNQFSGRHATATSCASPATDGEVQVFPLGATAPSPVPREPKVATDFYRDPPSYARQTWVAFHLVFVVSPAGRGAPIVISRRRLRTTRRQVVGKKSPFKFSSRRVDFAFPSSRFSLRN